MTTRRFEHPKVEIEEHPEGLLMRFTVPASKFGPVEVVQSVAESARLSDDLIDARRARRVKRAAAR